MEKTKPRILVVDDEEGIRRLLRLNLHLQGYDVDTVASGEETLRMGADLARYDLMLLDVMMDGIDGFELARRLRQDPATSSIPLIFCTARCAPDDEVLGLEMGGEDYITKPFTMATLLARVRKVLSHHAAAHKAPPTPPLRQGGIAMDVERRLASVDGRPVALTPNEWGLLEILMAHPGRVFSRSELLEAVRGQGVIVVDRTIDVNILHLRRKLAPYSSCLVTRSGWGYTFVAP